MGRESSLLSATFDPLELYTAAIDTSDYVARVAPAVRAGLPEVGSLLDIGAGGGQLGAALGGASGRWTAIEPSPTMRRRLEALRPPPSIVGAEWEQAALTAGGHDTVLAATMPAYFDQPAAFLARCRAWARRAVVWVVPAHAGPRGLIFAGCLPSAWHGEDETPGIDVVFAGLPNAARPEDIAYAEWTFSGIVRNLETLAHYLADRLGWSAGDARRPQLARHLADQARPQDGGWRLDIPRKSAVLIWRLS